MTTLRALSCSTGNELFVARGSLKTYRTLGACTTRNHVRYNRIRVCSVLCCEVFVWASICSRQQTLRNVCPCKFQPPSPIELMSGGGGHGINDFLRVSTNKIRSLVLRTSSFHPVWALHFPFIAWFAFLFLQPVWPPPEAASLPSSPSLKPLPGQLGAPLHA